MEEFNFEEFKSAGRYNMVISLGESERFFLGGAFCRKYNIASAKAVKLFYDKNKMAVGFKFIAEKVDGSIELKKLQTDSYYINAKEFLGMYDISSKKYAYRYSPEEITSPNGERTFVIRLKEQTDIPLN